MLLKLNTTGAAATVVSTKVDAKQKLAPKTWWAITISTAFVVKTMCMVSNVIFQVSPFPAVKEFYSKSDTGERDAAPYISIFFGGFQWCFYGLYAYVVTDKSGFLVLVYSNFLGAILGSYYTFGFWQNCKDGSAVRRLYKYLGFAAVLMLAQLCAMCSLPAQRSLFFSGLISSVCSVMMSLSMLATVPIVFETRCSASIDVTVTSIAVVSAVLWLTCGCILKDKWIVVPNSIGLCILLFTLSLSVRFPRDQAAAEALLVRSGDARLPGPGASGWGAETAEAAEATAIVQSALAAGGGRLGYGALDLRKAGAYCGDTGGTL